jgi:hypothetical protein
MENFGATENSQQQTTMGNLAQRKSRATISKNLVQKKEG